MEEHTLEFHRKALNYLCRICGRRAKKEKNNKSPKNVVSYENQIECYFGIDTSKDIDTVHPDKICNACYAIIAFKKNNGSQERKAIMEYDKNWTAYDQMSSTSECHPCSLFIFQTKGGSYKTSWFQVVYKKRYTPTPFFSLNQWPNEPAPPGVTQTVLLPHQHHPSGLTPTTPMGLSPVTPHMHQAPTQGVISTAPMDPQMHQTPRRGVLSTAPAGVPMHQPPTPGEPHSTSVSPHQPEPPPPGVTSDSPAMPRIPPPPPQGVLSTAPATPCMHRPPPPGVPHNTSVSPHQPEPPSPGVPHNTSVSLNQPELPPPGVTSDSPTTPCMPRPPPQGVLSTTPATPCMHRPPPPGVPHNTSVSPHQPEPLVSSHKPEPPPTGVTPGSQATPHMHRPPLQRVLSTAPATPRMHRPFSPGVLYTARSTHHLHQPLRVLNITPATTQLPPSPLPGVPLEANSQLLPWSSSCEQHAPSRAPPRRLFSQSAPPRSISHGDLSCLSSAQPNPKELSSSLTKLKEKIIQDLIDSPRNVPLDMKEEELVTSLVLRKKCDKNGLLKFKTKGKPFYHKRITKAQKSSSIVKTPTKKKRSKELEKSRKVVAGEENTTAQLATDIKVLPNSKKNDMVKSLGIKKIYRTSHDNLKLQANGNFSNNQMRLIKQDHSTTCGIPSASENKDRQLKNEILGNLLITEMKTFSFKNSDSHDSKGGFIEKQVPVCRVQDLCQLTHFLLKSYDEKGLLKGVPTGVDEIWVKIGSDFGGTSQKVTYQILNIDDPNSNFNTYTVFNAECKDYHSNLKVIFDSINPDIDRLQSLTWMGKKVRLFHCGDLAYLCLLYGTSGCSGVHSCLFCVITHREMQEKHAQLFTERDLDSMKSQHLRYMEKTGGNKDQVKNFQNMKNLPLVNIEITHVCPPVLHIKQGCVKRHFGLMEKHAFKIDVLLGEATAEEEDVMLDPDVLYERWILEQRQIVSLHCDIEQIIYDLRCNGIAEEEINETAPIPEKRKEIETLQANSALSLLSGPVVAKLGSVLNKHNVKIQAFHKRSFNGNHSNKFLKEHVYMDLTNAMRESVEEWCTTAAITIPEEIDDLLDETWKFDELNRKLSKALSLIAGCSTVDNDHINMSQNAIDDYMSFLRNHFPNQICPKQHILEQHVVPWMKRYRCRLDLHGEQGLEHIHQRFNKITSVTNHMKIPEKRLMVEMRKHFIENIMRVIYCEKRPKRGKKRAALNPIDPHNAE